MLKIENLTVAIKEENILNGLNLTVGEGEVHAIMGPNGSGKSTLAYVLAGKPGYQVTAGSVNYQQQDLLQLAPDERARQGLFLGFQYPIEIPGVNNAYFIKAAVNSCRRQNGLPELDAFDFKTEVKKYLEVLSIDDSFLTRSVNSGFSGGEKKRNEILQMMMMEPKLAVLDETDSGLDIDALKIVAKGVNSLRDKKRSFVLITHYQRLLNYIEPDFVHVLLQGKIIKSGGKDLAVKLEKQGYGWLENIDQPSRVGE